MTIESNPLHERVQDLEAENARYRAALEYYANRDNHKAITVLIPLDLDEDGVSELRYDFGLVAQAALYEGVAPEQIFSPRGQKYVERLRALEALAGAVREYRNTLARTGSTPDPDSLGGMWLKPVFEAVDKVPASVTDSPEE